MNMRSNPHKLSILCFLLIFTISGLFFLDRAAAKADLLPEDLPHGSDAGTLNAPAVLGEIAYVPLNSSDALALIDTQTHSTIGTIDLAQYGGEYPSLARLNPDGTELYVVCANSSTGYLEILVLETTGHTLVATIPVDHQHGYAVEVAFVQRGDFALLSNGYDDSYDIDVIDTATHTIIQSIPTSNYKIMSITAHPYLPLAYAAGTQGYSVGGVLVIDTDIFSLQTIIPYGGIFGGGLWDVQVSPDGQWVFASGDWLYEQGGIIKIEVSTNTIVDALSGYEIVDLNISPDNSRIYAHQNYEQEILVIDSDTLDVITSIYLNNSSRESQITCDGSELYAVGGLNIVSVFDTQTYSLTHEILLPENGTYYGFALCPPHLAQGAIFSPPSQDEFARAGEPLTYTLELINLTGVTDSFDLHVLPGNTWTTTLSAAQVGPIADGEGITLTAWVEVPEDAQPGENDIATIQTASVTSPTVYTSTATLDTFVLSEELAYVTVQFSNAVVIVDVDTQSVVDTIYTHATGCSMPLRAVMSPDGEYVYVGCLGSFTVLVIDTHTFSAVANIPGIAAADDVAFTRSGDYALAGSHDQNQIAIIDTETLTVVQYISTSDQPESIAVHPYLERAYAAMYSGEILVIDTSTFTVTGSIDTDANLWDVAVSPDGKWVFADDLDAGSFWVIDAATNSIHTFITGLGQLTGIEVSSDGAYIYVGGVDCVWVIDGHTFELITDIPLNNGAFELSLTSDDAQLYAVMLGPDVAVIDTAAFTVSNYIPMEGEYSFGIAIHPEYIGKNVLLEPGEQTRQGGRGEVVEYTIDLINYTLITDTFSLSLGESAWEASLSSDMIGPLPDGSTASFSIYVTVPQDAPWYISDTVTVTAESLTNLGVFTATAQATTVAYAPPQISVDPMSLESTQVVGEVTTQTLTISNGEGVTLTYEISAGLGITWLSTEPLSGSVPTDSSFPVEVTFDATGLQPDTYTTTLFITSNDPLQPLLTVPVTMTVVEQQAGVEITPSEAAQSGSPGEMVTYTLTLTNLGNAADSFTLEVSSTWTATLSADSTGALEPGRTFTFTLMVSIPPEAEDLAYDMALLTATSANDPGVTAEAQATTTALIQPVEVQFLYLSLVYKT